jgi:hypothetical protein
MINGAEEWLRRARDGFTDPAEHTAIDMLLDWEPVVAVLSVTEGRPVWLFTAGPHQLAVPVSLMPEMTQHAREQGLLDKFLEAFEEEVQELLSGVKQALEAA